MSAQSVWHLPVSRRSWRCMRLCCCPWVGWCARTERSWRAQQWPDCPEGGCRKYTALNNKKYIWYIQYMLCVYPGLEDFWCSTVFYLFIIFFLPKNVLTNSRESWDILIVDDVSVQGRLCHQVGPCQWRVHQGETWEINQQVDNIINQCLNIYINNIQKPNKENGTHKKNPQRGKCSYISYCLCIYNFLFTLYQYTCTKTAQKFIKPKVKPRYRCLIIKSFKCKHKNKKSKSQINTNIWWFNIFRVDFILFFCFFVKLDTYKRFLLVASPKYSWVQQIDGTHFNYTLYPKSSLLRKIAASKDARYHTAVMVLSNPVQW